MTKQHIALFLDDERYPENINWNTPKIISNNTLANHEQELYIGNIHNNSIITKTYRNPNDFILDFHNYLINNEIHYIHLSFDHDINWFNDNQETTGYTVTKEIINKLMDIEQELNNPIEFQKIVEKINIYVHSQNPIGAKNILEYWHNWFKQYR